MFRPLDFDRPRPELPLFLLPLTVKASPEDSDTSESFLRILSFRTKSLISPNFSFSSFLVEEVTEVTKFSQDLGRVANSMLAFISSSKLNPTEVNFDSIIFNSFILSCISPDSCILNSNKRRNTYTLFTAEGFSYVFCKASSRSFVVF